MTGALVVHTQPVSASVSPACTNVNAPGISDEGALLSKSIALVSTNLEPTPPAAVTTYIPLYGVFVSVSFLIKTRSVAAGFCPSRDNAPLTEAVIVAPTPDTPLSYAYAGNAAAEA